MDRDKRKRAEGGRESWLEEQNKKHREQSDQAEKSNTIAILVVDHGNNPIHSVAVSLLMLALRITNSADTSRLLLGPKQRHDATETR